MTTTMIDATSASAGNIPSGSPKVAGYVTGTSEVRWTPQDWARFDPATTSLVRIDQGFTWPPLPTSYDVLDVENLAVTAAEVPAAVQARIAAGITWTTVYGSASALAAVEARLRAAPFGAGWYYGHVDCWLADWNLNEAEATALLGTRISGLTCTAVQWASPASNPGTVLPGSTLTLAQSNCDLSVTT
jgi:hypothetical protein